ncbi:2-oxoglutarate synthase subunit KorB [Candidatus Tiddalikarchaeum anstoanum]|nr:2-oxoglutarate synthase subunit KorB [Candidatus Tiddalikarchaeum anstoanum]
MIPSIELETKGLPNWCPGCGNYGILTALKQALSELDIPQKDIVLTSGIGCSSKIPHWVRVYAYNGLHGRALPLAEGIRLANNKLTVITCGGDGDGYAEGTAHFIHFSRYNMNIKYFVHDNQVYGLTKGQVSPTSDEGFVTKTTPFGSVEKALNPLIMALSAGATFAARGYAGNVSQLKELMKKAIMHKGSALLDILQPCVTFNHKNTYEWYSKRVYELETPLKTRNEAISKAAEWGEKIPVGVFFDSDEETYEDKLPQLKEKSLIEEEPKTDIKQLLKELK